MKLTLLMAVRNEAERLRPFLSHHAVHFDEVVIVHDGKCTDATLEIVRQHPNALVYERPGEHNPLPHREWALRNAINGGWVLVLDADEWLPDDTLSRLRSSISEAEKRGCDGITIDMHLFIDEELAGVYEMWRLFKHSDEVHYPSHPHGGIEGLTLGYSSHLSFANHCRADEYPSKLRRRRAHLLRCIANEPNSPRRSAWEIGMLPLPEIAKILSDKGISLSVDGQPLARIKGIGGKMANRFAHELGIETLEEFVAGDADYMNRVLRLGQSRIEAMQDAVRRAI